MELTTQRLILGDWCVSYVSRQYCRLSMLQHCILYDVTSVEVTIATISCYSVIHSAPCMDSGTILPIKRAIKANSRTDPFIQKLFPFNKWCSRNQYSNKTPSNSSRAFKIQPWEPRIKIQFCRWHEIQQNVMVFENY